MDKDICDKFFELIRFSIDANATIPMDINKDDWSILYETARKHALVGVCASGIERMSEGMRPPRNIALRWATATLEIEARNRQINRRCVELTSRLTDNGLRTCILKGQGLAVLYPNPLRRQSGDIDVWVDGGRKMLVDYVRRLFPKMGFRYHHIDYPIFRDVSVEIHFMPSWMCAPGSNRRLQRWFEKQSDIVFNNLCDLPENAGRIFVPTIDFNVVYVMLHIYRHFFDEGIGLRQVMDYYFVIRNSSIQRNEETLTLLKELGLYGFARAMMYVMREVFGLEERYMIVSPSENDGAFVLHEIFRAGNFGHDNDAIFRTNGKSLCYFKTKLDYKLHFFRRYPKETLWGNVFWIWQRIWRIWNE